MILYFADRRMKILGHASTVLKKGYPIKDDLKTEEIETGVSTFECFIGFNDKNRKALEEMTNAGNYLLRSSDGENEFYTIIESEIDTKSKEIHIYAEDAGLDLLNEIAGEFEADASYNAEWYINKYIIDSGFEIGINEIPSSDKRKLKWEGEETVTARLASIATQFGGYEIAFSFEIRGMEITDKKLNIYKERGNDYGVTLRLNRELDKIITTKTVANLATAFVCEGGVPDDAEEPITLKGYKYDDGDFYVDDNGTLKSRKAVEKWSRYVWNKEPNKLNGYEGHIVRPYSYNTTDQKTLCSHAITELKKICDMEVNYEIDVNRLPEGVKIGDRVNIVDDGGELYVSSRILLLENSITDNKHTATLGEHLIKKSGISQKVADLAAEFAKNSQSAARALSIASGAKVSAEEAKAQAAAAASEAAGVSAKADEAKSAAEAAAQSAGNAAAKAEAAAAAVEIVESSVSSLETTVTEAKAAANAAQAAAATATAEAGAAKAAAANAQTKATEAESNAGAAKTSAENAAIKSAEALTKADAAKDNAKSALDTARAAKLDAEQAERDVEALSDNLETITDTIKADYARKTELTETAAHLETQISKNAAGLRITSSLLMTVDETANDAREKAEAALAEAAAAQTKANEASAEAEAAQTAAAQAAQAAINAQSEADEAKAAADTAQSVADRAETLLEAAKVDLATIEARADATEEEIAAAQTAVNTAQAAANAAKAEADTAAQTAAEAQTAATTAAANAWKALNDANLAQMNAEHAQQLAEKANGEYEAADAEAAQAESKASQAKATADEAQRAADEAKATASAAVNTAELAQSTADAAVATAEAAQAEAAEAVKKSEQAQADLDNAEIRLAEVLADAEATEEEITAAQADVDTATAAAAAAAAAAETAQSAADNAAATATAAQSEAAEAQARAQNAQDAANEAEDAANEAQAAVDGLAVRVTKAEASITQNNREITLRVAEVKETATKNEKNISKAESLIQMLSDSIAMLVTDGNGSSLMVQTEDGWTFSTGALQEAVNDATSQLGELSGALGSTQATVDTLNAAVQDLGILAEYIKIGTYSYTDENGVSQTEPSIDLGENDTGFKLKITNTRILFTDGSNELVSINSKTKSLDIEKATIKGDLQIGDNASNEAGGVWIWKRRSNGNLGLIWKGAVN